ncbi:sigma-70 family RNA polymerase sigma factor [Arachidicoccus soli]|uniref:Sigma-70 family RNA polymerase sigma factor n=1 Tax=Arachidicoccus soli TaxID=2341117 RepID=A0A386HTI3_9BACT|nr:sigma-70 family RNA polymerase sigma factor [Arachidicoccus soli]AYD48604.1 sigma-70 family RNA polymerase sigma factor [Arachidicoccus soli]
MESQFEQYADYDIIKRINEGEIKLFEILIRRYDPFLYKIGRTYHYNHEDTEDLMQDAYMNAYCSLKKFENRSSFKTWLTRIMLNICYQKKRKMSIKKEVVTSGIQNEESGQLSQPSSYGNEKITMNKELGHVLENAIHSIPEDYRIVFTLRELNGLNVAETSEALNISESNVKVRLNRAKTMLQKEIKKMYSPQEIFEFNLIYCDVMVNRVMNKIYELREKALKDKLLE